MKGVNDSEQALLLFISQSTNKQLNALEKRIQERKEAIKDGRKHQLLSSIRDLLTKYKLEAGVIDIYDKGDLYKFQRCSFSVSYGEGLQVSFSIEFMEMKHIACIGTPTNAIPFRVKERESFCYAESEEDAWSKYRQDREEVLKTYHESFREVLRDFYNIAHEIIRARYKIYGIYDYDTDEYLEH